MRAGRCLVHFWLCLAAMAACGGGHSPADPPWNGPAPPPRTRWKAPPLPWNGYDRGLGSQGLADLRNGDFARAVADEDGVIRQGRARAEDYAIRANAEAATERLPSAWADFEQAIRLDPAAERPYIDFGVWLDRAHQPRRGVGVLTAATRVLPRSAGCYALLGWLQCQAGQYPQSIASSRRAEALDSSLPYVRFNQALCFAAMGDATRSAAAYRRALASGSDETRQAALMEIRNSLRKHPNSAALRQAEAMLQARRGHPPFHPFPPFRSP